MASISSILLQVLVIQFLVALGVSQRPSFYYFGQEVRSALCASTEGCCFPTVGKLADNFTIHGLFPSLSNGTLLSYCEGNSFDRLELRGLIRRMQRNWPSFSCPSSNSESFWAYQWKKYGTCSLPTFGTQHAYFKAALDLKDRVDLLQILEDEESNPPDNITVGRKSSKPSERQHDIFPRWSAQTTSLGAISSAKFTCAWINLGLTSSSARSTSRPPVIPSSDLLLSMMMQLLEGSTFLPELLLDSTNIYK